MKRIILALTIGLLMLSCADKTKEELPDDSVYHLTSEWEDQNGNTIKLNQLKGDAVVMVMIYTSCKTACPRLTADMNTISQKLNKRNAKNLKYVFVSIDPEKDTPEKMKQYLMTYGFTGEEWLFLRSSADNTRELANVLAVKYKEISPLDFSHSNIISVFNKKGHLAYQKEGFNNDIDGTVKQIKKQLN